MKNTSVETNELPAGFLHYEESYWKDKSDYIPFFLTINLLNDQRKHLISGKLNHVRNPWLICTGHTHCGFILFICLDNVSAGCIILFLLRSQRKGYR